MGYIPSYNQVISGGWNIADCVSRAYDVEGMNVGTVASGRIGLAVLRRMHPFDAKMLGTMKKGAYIVNTARGKICDRDAIAAALETGQLAGYAGDVWFPQPLPKDHPWRSMPWHAMTPHTSGTTLSAQQRYANGVQEILECHFAGENIRDEYLIVKDGQLA